MKGPLPTDSQVDNDLSHGPLTLVVARFELATVGMEDFLAVLIFLLEVHADHGFLGDATVEVLVEVLAPEGLMMTIEAILHALACGTEGTDGLVVKVYGDLLLDLFGVSGITT